MYFACPFKEEFLVQYMQESKASGALIDAYNLLNDNELSKGHDILDDLIKHGCSLALVLSSMFSKQGESEGEFYNRHLECLQRAADNREPLALYSLGVYHDTGEMVEHDELKANDYFKEAANLGMPQAEHLYGIMLYYGTGGAQQDKAKGLSMIQAAEQKGVTEAKEFLQYLEQSELGSE